MKKNLLLVFCMLNTMFALLQAQKTNRSAQHPAVKELIQNPDILWVGEFTSVFLLDEFDSKKLNNPTFLDSMGIKNNEHVWLALIKNLDNREHYLPTPECYTLAKMITDTSRLLYFTTYQDANCAQPFLPEQLLEAMTVQDTFQSNKQTTMEIRINRLTYLVSTQHIESYQAKHIIYYNRQTNTIGSLMLSIAPIVNYYTDEGIFIKQQPLFWIPIQNTNKKDLNNSAINWARRTTRDFDWKDATILKSTKSVEYCLELYLKNIANNAQKEKLHRFFYDLPLLSVQEIENIRKQNNSSNNFGYSGSTKIATDTVLIKGQDIHQFKLMQEWYWDYKKNTLSVAPLFFCPILTKFHEGEQRHYKKPLFWRALK